MTKINRFPWDGLALVLVLLACFALWQKTNTVRDNWAGVPPPPDAPRALSYGFGDAQFSYRRIGLMLQNEGDTGGRVTNLRDYNYQILRDWFDLSFELDPRANYIPSLAAYLFGSVKQADHIKHLVDYLAKVGEVDEAQNWRWLSQAVYIARFELDDQPLALKLAYRLAALNQPDMPIWTKQMPAFVMSKTGQKKAGRDLMLTIAATDKSMAQPDINQTCWYINKHLREPNDRLEDEELYRLICETNQEWKKIK